jgi:hypothetical protein
MTDYEGRDGRLAGELGMADRKAAEHIVELAGRAERLAQALSDLRRRIDARPRRRSSGNLPAIPLPPPSQPESDPEPISTEPPTVPVRRDTPSSSDTLLWLPILKQRSPSRPSTKNAVRSASEPPLLSVTSGRPPASGVRRRDPDAGRYSIIAAGRSKRRANG